MSSDRTHDDCCAVCSGVSVLMVCWCRVGAGVMLLFHITNELNPHNNNNFRVRLFTRIPFKINVCLAVFLIDRS